MKRSTVSKLFRRTIWILALMLLAIGYWYYSSTQESIHKATPAQVFTH